MKLETETTVRRATGPAGEGRGVPSAPGEAVEVSKTVAEAVRGLEETGARFVAVAPGRLDVMGGLAEYAGALVLSLPLGHHACAAVQHRQDGLVRIVAGSGREGVGGLDFPVVKFAEAQHNGAATHRASEWMSGALDRSTIAALGALVEGVRAGLCAIPSGGLSIRLGSTLDDVPGGGRDSAVAAATLTACAAASEKSADATALAGVCQRVENHWLDWSVGPADAVCALVGEAGVVQMASSETGAASGSVAMPDGLGVVAVDSGVAHADAAAKFGHVRTATFMGRALIDRIIRHEGIKNLRWDGWLCRLSVTDFVERFRDRIPTKITGQEFLERFGETGDPLTKIDSSSIYKVRSRTEHHIYEHARARQLVECLTRAGRMTDCSPLLEAQEVLNASHWSYGQRCGLGSVETDLLVNLIRRHGANADIYGAKVTGRGCGGLVAVLLKRTDAAFAALTRAVEDYNARNGHRGRILAGSISGALVSGVQRL